MRRYISVNAEAREALMEKYRVSKVTIWEACSFITKNRRSDNIRRDAMEMGGIYKEEDFIPNCETTFVKGGMVQRFATGVEVVTSGKTMQLVVPGSVPQKYKNVDILAWSNILERAQSIAEERMMKSVI